MTYNYDRHHGTHAAQLSVAHTDGRSKNHLEMTSDFSLLNQQQCKMNLFSDSFFSGDPNIQAPEHVLKSAGVSLGPEARKEGQGGMVVWL